MCCVWRFSDIELYRLALMLFPSGQRSQSLSSMVTVPLRYLTLAVLVVLISQLYYSQLCLAWISVIFVNSTNKHCIVTLLLISVWDVLRFLLDHSSSIVNFFLLVLVSFCSFARTWLTLYWFQNFAFFLFKIHMLLLALLIHYTVVGRGKVGAWLFVSICYYFQPGIWPISRVRRWY
jgi:hypothetical protein